MIEIINLNKTYETGNRALQNINITIDDGEFVFIMGRSGSGKSTLMKLLLKAVSYTHLDVYKRQPLPGHCPRWRRTGRNRWRTWPGR